jgi:hypothetical protein
MIEDKVGKLNLVDEASRAFVSGLALFALQKRGYYPLTPLDPPQGMTTDPTHPDDALVMWNISRTRSLSLRSVYEALYSNPMGLKRAINPSSVSFQAGL